MDGGGVAGLTFTALSYKSLHVCLPAAVDSILCCADRSDIWNVLWSTVTLWTIFRQFSEKSTVSHVAFHLSNSRPLLPSMPDLLTCTVIAGRYLCLTL